MKAFQSVCQGVHRQVADQVLESAESTTHLPGVFGAGDCVTRMCAFHVADGAPEIVFFVEIKIISGMRLQDMRHFP
jgi:hypothetical protein